MSKTIYEVAINPESGYMIKGGSLNRMFIKDKEDADKIAAALNLYESARKSLKIVNSAKSELKKLSVALQAIDSLAQAKSFNHD